MELQILRCFYYVGIKYIEGKPHVWILDEYYNKGTKKNKNGQEEKITKTDDMFLKDYKKLIKDIEVRKVIIDPSATSLINLFKQNKIAVKEADNAVIDGINLVLNWLDEGRIHIVEERCYIEILLENSIHTYGMKKHRKKVRTSQLNKMITH